MHRGRERRKDQSGGECTEGWTVAKDSTQQISQERGWLPQNERPQQLGREDPEIFASASIEKLRMS